MIAPDLQTAIDHLRGLIDRARVIVPFTGAGISTECGIPDFRSPGGLWTRNHPIPYQDFIASQEMRNEAWRRRFALERNFSAARPGRGHRALASLHHTGKIPAVITQNIDNLHQASGFASECVVELHGNTTYALCLGCEQRYELSWVRERFEPAEEAPDCPGCGGHIKSATVSFGQSMPVAAMQRAEELTLDCDAFIAVGSSLVVWPAAGFPLMAKRNGSALVIINREPTDFDNLADLVVRQDIGDVFAPFV
jgi:NAD-dependent protein deacetylase/lipoamidase